MTEKDKTQVEFHPDAWQRFERAIDVVAKSPPQHRTKPKSKKRSRSPSKKRKAS